MGIPEPTGVIEVRVEPGNDVIETLQNQLRTLNVKHGAIVSVIGSVNSCRIINKPKKGVKTDIYTDFREDLDLSGSGEVRDAKPDIRIILSLEAGRTVSGKLHSAKSTK